MILFPIVDFVGIIVSSLSEASYDGTIWSPIDLLGRIFGDDSEDYEVKYVQILSEVCMGYEGVWITDSTTLTQRYFWHVVTSLRIRPTTGPSSTTYFELSLA
jgi:hypothetical protein